MAMFKCNGALFNGTINIYTVAGSTVTATTSGTTQVYTAVAGVTGLASIRVKKRGTYAIASTGTSRLGHATVNNATPVTAYYIWQKWNSILTYSQSSYYVGAGGSFWTGNWSSSWNFATGYSFNSSTGQFTLSGGSSSALRTDSSRNMVTDNSSRYCGYPNTYNPSSNVCSQIAYSNNVSPIRANSAGYVAPSDSFGATGGAYVYYATGTYSKGSTQYANANETNLNAHPTNGRDTTDGYWYIAA